MAKAKKSSRRQPDLLRGPATLPHAGKARKPTHDVPSIAISTNRSLVSHFDAGVKIRASTAAAPCKAGRDRTGRLTGATRCPIQLAFIKGKAYIRACGERTSAARGTAGLLFEVKNPADAVRVSDKVCACWKKAGGMKAPPTWLDRCAAVKKKGAVRG